MTDEMELWKQETLDLLSELRDMQENGGNVFLVQLAYIFQKFPKAREKWVGDNVVVELGNDDMIVYDVRDNSWSLLAKEWMLK